MVERVKIAYDDMPIVRFPCKNNRSGSCERHDVAVEDAMQQVMNQMRKYSMIQVDPAAARTPREPLTLPLHGRSQGPREALALPPPYLELTTQQSGCAPATVHAAYTPLAGPRAHASRRASPLTRRPAYAPPRRSASQLGDYRKVEFKAF